MKESKLKSIVCNDRGTASIFLLVSFAVLMVVMAMVADIARLYAVKVAARHALNLALRAATTQVDRDELAKGNIMFNNAQAEAKFYEVLRQNLRLDSNNNPLSGSIADGQVEVCRFYVIGDNMVGDLPFVYGYDYGNGKTYSEAIDKPGATGIIKIPVKLGGLARFARADAPDTTDLYVHSTVVVEMTEPPQGG